MTHEPVTTWSVSELNQALQATLARDYAHVRVSGEISNLVCAGSGHRYFSLKDHKAQLKCVLFKGIASSVSIANGQQWIAQGALQVYAPRGDHQLMVRALLPQGAGALAQALEQLRQQLAMEGWFALERKQSIPKHPQAIGVITSPQGAAIRDILQVLKRRMPSIPVWIYPTQVQGEQAASQICAALQQAHAHGQASTLIVARGGGSLEDIWPFNEASVVRAIASSTLPVICGVGHETDTTLSDWAADLRAPTPSAAAELACPDRHALASHRQQQQARLQQAMHTHIHHASQRLDFAGHRLQQQSIQHKLQHMRTLHQQLRHRLLQGMQTSWQHHSRQLDPLQAKLHALDPNAPLQRGYAMVRDPHDQPVVSARAAAQHHSLQVLFHDGAVRVTTDHPAPDTAV